METVIDPIDAYVIEYEKITLIKLCIKNKFNEKTVENPLFFSEDENARLLEMIYINDLKYTYLQLVEEFKILCKL